MPLDLLVPALLVPPDAPAALRALRLPGLERWLARGEIERVPATLASGWLAGEFALAEPLPHAAIALAGEAGTARPGEWLHADPVYMRVDRDAVTLHDATVLEATRAEAEAIVATLQAHFRDDGLEFHIAAPDRWYLRVPEGEAPRTTALEAARGRNVFGLLPRGSGRINWGSAITEAQMLLASHEVNRVREASGRPAVNGVWLWGEGAAPQGLARRYALAHARDPFARGLARLSGAAPGDVPASLAAVDLVAAGASALVVLDALCFPLARADAAAWTHAAEALDEHWFRGLGEAIERFDRVRVILPAAGGSVIAHLDARARRRWWRAGKPLPHG